MVILDGPLEGFFDVVLTGDGFQSCSCNLKKPLVALSQTNKTFLPNVAIALAVLVVGGAVFCNTFLRPPAQDLRRRKSWIKLGHNIHQKTWFSILAKLHMR